MEPYANFPPHLLRFFAEYFRYNPNQILLAYSTAASDVLPDTSNEGRSTVQHRPALTVALTSSRILVLSPKRVRGLAGLRKIQCEMEVRHEIALDSVEQVCKARSSIYVASLGGHL